MSGEKLSPKQRLRLSAERAAARREVSDAAVEPAIIFKDIMAYARMEHGAGPFYALTRGPMARAEPALLKDMKGIDREDKRRVALPWVALHEATRDVMRVGNPDARLAQLYFLSRAHNIACQDLGARLERACDGASGYAGRIIAGPTANHATAYFGLVAKSIRPDDFGDADRLAPYRWDMVSRGEHIAESARKLKITFAAAHNGQLPTSVEKSYVNMRQKIDGFNIKDVPHHG